MNKEQLFDAIDKIDDKYVSETENYDPETMKIRAFPFIHILPAVLVTASAASVFLAVYLGSQVKPPGDFEIDNSVTETTTSVSEQYTSEVSDSVKPVTEPENVTDTAVSGSDGSSPADTGSSVTEVSAGASADPNVVIVSGNTAVSPKPTATHSGEVTGPSASPAVTQTVRPTSSPTNKPTATATVKPTVSVSASPSPTATVRPTVTPTRSPQPTRTPGTMSPTASPTASGGPTMSPTKTASPTRTSAPTMNPTRTSAPTMNPTRTSAPTMSPTGTSAPTMSPTRSPRPTSTPTMYPTGFSEPSIDPTSAPTMAPTGTSAPTMSPTRSPHPTSQPTESRTGAPDPTSQPTDSGTYGPKPTMTPTSAPTMSPTGTSAPTSMPTGYYPTSAPTMSPTDYPTGAPHGPSDPELRPTDAPVTDPLPEVIFSNSASLERFINDRRYDQDRYSQSLRDAAEKISTEGFFYVPENDGFENSEVVMVSTADSVDAGLVYYANRGGYLCSIGVYSVDEDTFAQSENERAYIRNRYGEYEGNTYKLDSSNVRYNNEGAFFFIDDTHYCYIRSSLEDTELKKIINDLSFTKIYVD